MNAVGGHIRKLRRKENMTQQSLADRLNVTRQAVSQWENGNTQPDLDTLAAIAGVFGVDMTEVIYGEKRRETTGIDSERRKRYLAGLIVFGALTVVMMVLELFLRPYLSHLFRTEFNSGIRYYIYFATPLLYLFISQAALSGSSLVWDIRVRHRNARKIILLVVTAYLLFHYGAGIIYMRENIELPGLIFYYQIYFITHAPVVFLIPGIGLFLGLNGRRSEPKTTSTE